MSQASSSQGLRDVPLCIAVDKSGSTWGKPLMEEIRSVLEICSLRSSNSDSPVLFLPWCDTVGEPISLPSDILALQQVRSGGGTNPAVLYSSPACVKALKECGLWILMTDGKIEDKLIQDFALTTANLQLHGKPCVIVVFGTAGRGRPADCNISVGIALYAVSPDCLFLFHDLPTGKLSVLQAKGCFKTIIPGAQPLLDDYTTWAELPHITYQDLRKVSIGPARDLSTEDLALQDGLVVNMRDLYSASMDDEYVSKLFQNEDNLKSVMLAEMTRGRENEWHSWLNKLEKPAPKLSRERPDIGQKAQQTIVRLLEALEDETAGEDTIAALRRSLREAHETNYSHFTRETVVAHEDKIEKIGRCNEALGRVKRSSRNTYERYRSKGASCMSAHADEDLLLVPGPPSRPQVQPLFLPGYNRSTSNHTSTEFRGECMLCHRNAILAILLKSPPNTITSNFPRRGSYSPLAFPLAMSNFAETDILSYSVCCDACAFHLAQNYTSLHEENVAGALPLVCVVENRDAFLEALDKALKGRFKTTDLLPLFVAILDRKITKNQARDVSIQEKSLYHQALIWMKQNIAKIAEVPHVLSLSFSTRRAHSRAGSLYTIISERALLDPSDPENEDISIVRYPVPGFMVLLRLLEDSGAGAANLQIYLFQRFIFHITEMYFTLLQQDGGNQVHPSLIRMLMSCPMQGINPETFVPGGSPVAAMSMDQILAHSLIDQETLTSFRTMPDFVEVESRMGAAADLYLYALGKLGSTFSQAVDCFNGLKSHNKASKAVLKPLAISAGLCVDMIREIERTSS